MDCSTSNSSIYETSAIICLNAVFVNEKLSKLILSIISLLSNIVFDIPFSNNDSTICFVFVSKAMLWFKSSIPT